MTDINIQPPLDPKLSLLYGGIAGSVAKTAIAPFDRVKIHFQIAHPELNEFRGKFTGVFGAVKRIYSQSGFLGLYRGHSATIARIFPYAAINFAAFEKFKLVLNAEQNQNHQNDWPWRKLVAGSLAGTIAVAVTYPFDIIRARIAFSLVTKSDTLDNQTKGFKSILQQLSNEGRLLTQSQTPLRGFYQGFVPTILGIIPYAGVSFFVFESSKQFLREQTKYEKLSSIQIFASGLFAGAMGQTISYPFDVIRRRMQLYKITDHLPSQHYNAGILTAIKSIVSTHGWLRGIFAGLSINYIKVAPASGISFLVYETLKNKYPIGLI